MLRIRLARVGKKKKPSYRIVVAEARAPRDGAYLEWIGTYDPMQDPPAITIKQDRALHWLRMGAQASDPVQRILDRNGVLAQMNGEAAPENEPVETESEAETEPTPVESEA